MNYYLRKYVGKYRVIAEIDQRTGDFCRDKSGIIATPMIFTLNV